MAVEGHLDSAELFRRFAPFVAGFLLRLGVQRPDLEDVMQEVFLVVHRNGGYVPGPAKPTSYLANIALRAATSHRRKRKTRSFVQSNLEAVGKAADVSGNPEQTAGRRQQLALLQQVLDKMEPDRRALFMLAELHGETVVSIASGLGIPVDTVYSRLRAARRMFREAAQAMFEAHDRQPIAPDMQRCET